MRKKTVNHLADTIFWYVVYFLPIIIYLLIFYRQGATNITFEAIFDAYGLGITENNIIVTTLNSIFGANGILPLFKDIGIIYMLAWFSSCLIIHLAIDVLLFIVRLAHKWINTYTQGD